MPARAHASAIACAIPLTVTLGMSGLHLFPYHVLFYLEGIYTINLAARALCHWIVPVPVYAGEGMPGRQAPCFGMPVAQEVQRDAAMRGMNWHASLEEGVLACLSPSCLAT